MVTAQTENCPNLAPEDIPARHPGGGVRRSERPALTVAPVVPRAPGTTPGRGSAEQAHRPGRNPHRRLLTRSNRPNWRRRSRRARYGGFRRWVRRCSVSWFPGDERHGLTITDSIGRLPHQRTLGKYRLRQGVKFPGLILGTIGEFVSRHIYFIVLWIWRYVLVFAPLSISSSVLPPC